MPFTLALDWTPNTNHSGFAVALAESWYVETGLEVVFTHPGDVDAEPIDREAMDAATLFTNELLPR